MPLSTLCGFGPTELVTLGGARPAVKPQWVRQIGIRSVDAGEREFVHAQNLEVFDMRCIDEIGIRKAMEIALGDMDEDCHLHVSFDVDFLDPELAPGVGTTVPGGLSYREAQLCMEMIADTGMMASLDIMELNPALDVRNKTAVITVELVQSMFGKSTLVRETALRTMQFSRSRQCVEPV
jgi:arginase